MEFILQMIPKSMYAMVISMFCLKFGNDLKNKDADNIGTEDAAGNVLIAFAAVAMAYDGKNESAFKKALRAVRDTINNYLGE